MEKEIEKEKIKEIESLISNLDEKLYKILYKIELCDEYLDKCAEEGKIEENTENFIIKIKERTDLEIERDSLIKQKSILEKQKENLKK